MAAQATFIVLVRCFLETGLPDQIILHSAAKFYSFIMCVCIILDNSIVKEIK